MLRPRRLGHHQNPSPQVPSQFPYRLSFKNPQTLIFVAALFLPQLMAEEPAKPKDWKTSLGLNLGLNGGNSETFTVGGNVLTIKEWGESNANILNGGADVNYGTSTLTSVSDPGGPNQSLLKTDTTNVNNLSLIHI